MKNKIKIIVQIITILITSFLFWYLMFGFVSNEFNIWKWEIVTRALYVIISYMTFIQTLKKLE
jgi:hypothetical protein